MARGVKFNSIIVAIPPEIIKLDDAQAARLEELFRTAVVEVVSMGATEDEEELSFQQINTNNTADLMAALGSGGGSASKKGAAKKGAAKKGAVK
jgi:hypothetical protein